jgi:hypothetical protein
MRFWDFFVGRQVRLRSPLHPRIAAERVNAAGKSRFSPFSTGVIGHVRWGRVHLRYRSSLLQYGPKPVLVGRLVDASPGSQLLLRYRAPAMAYLFFPFWYSFLAIVALHIVFSPEQVAGSRPLLAGVLLLLLVAPLVLHATGTRRSEEELGEMIAFLAEHAEAEPDRPS